MRIVNVSGSLCVTCFVLAAYGCAAPPGAGNDSGVPGSGNGTRPIRTVQPEYPARAMRARVQGCVTTSFDIMPDGRTDNYQIVDSRPQGVFVKTTLLSLKDWRFPEREEPLRKQLTIDYNITGRREDRRPKCDTNPELPEVYWVRGAR